MKITALIVTHNRLDKLMLTVDKTLSQGFTDVLIVNSGSNDGTELFLDALSDERITVLHTDNIGGAGGCALGAEYISHNINCDWVVFYDDDAYPDLQLVNNIKQQNLTDVDSFACHVSSRDQVMPQMNVAVKKYPTTLARLLRYIKNRKAFVTQEGDLVLPNQPIEASSFVGFGVRHSVLKQTYQYIHSMLFIYYDDLFYTLKLSQLGCRHQFIPSLTFVHDVEKTEKVVPWKLYYHTKNLFIMRPLCSFPAFIGLALMKVTSVALVALRSQYPWQNFKLILLGFFDGVMSKHDRFGLVDPVKKIIKRHVNKR